MSFIMLEMTEEQKSSVDKLASEPDTCFCGAPLLLGSARGLITQPNSFYAREDIGKLKVVALCEECFEHISKAIMERKK